MQVIGYARLSKAESGHGLSVQRRAIKDFCQRRGFELLRVEEDDGASGRSPRKRPRLQRALNACRSEGCRAIVATRQRSDLPARSPAIGPLRADALAERAF